MASREDYEQDLRSAIADQKNELYPYLQHLGQVAESGPLYHGKTGQVHQLRYRGTSTPDDLGGAYATATGAEILASYRAAAGEPRVGIDGVTPVDPEQYYQSLIGELGEELDPNQRYLVHGLGATAKTPFYAPVGKLVTDPNTGKHSLVELQRVATDYDPSRLVGMEQIRAGELDNAINGIKEQLGASFDTQWNRTYAQKLANLPDEKRGEIYRQMRERFFAGVNWADYIKHDPYVGLYTDMGAVKHVNDRGSRWDDYALPVMTALVSAVTGGTAGAALGKMAGAAASSAVGGSTAGAAAGTTAGATTGAAAGTAGGAAAGTTAAATAAGTIAGGATQGLVGSLIGSAMTGNKITGKNLATSMLMGGLTPAAQSILAGTIGKIGTTATLEAIRQAATNKGKIDPRMLAANTAGQTVAGYVGDRLSDNGLVGRFLGGVSGNAVNQMVRGNGVSGEGLLYAGVNNTGTAGQLLGKAAQTYQRQMALRQQTSRRRPGG